MSPAVFSDQFPGVLPEHDVHVLTSGGIRIPAHSSVLAMASPVLETVMERPRKHRCSERVIPILGVPCEAVSAFISCLYSPSRCSVETNVMEKFGIHLLALSHVYSVPHLKQACIKSLVNRLTVENVVDVLQLARLCDAPDLYLKCLKLVSSKFKSVETTEGWKFLHKYDPWLELDILQFIEESETRRKRSRKHKQDQRVYLQLSEAMECLVHICTDGCTTVTPYDSDPTKKREPCGKFSTCRSVQLLIQHFATCNERRRNSGGGGVCSQCTRVLQLLRLHAYLCDQPGNLCRVPLCRQMKMKMMIQQEKRSGEDTKWRILAKKVVVAKAASCLSAAASKRKRVEEEQHPAVVVERGLRFNHRSLQGLRLCNKNGASRSLMAVVPPV